MPKYLIQGSYNAEGAKGLKKDGAASRRAAVEAMLKGVGGTLESMHFAFGETDVFIIADVPDSIAAAAVGLGVNMSGVVRTTTTVLLTPEEMDQAIVVQTGYRAPGR